jgi:hypothetical protein
MMLSHPALDRLVASDLLDRALGLLRPHELAVAALRADGLTDPEIGALLDITPAAVSARMAAARLRIEQSMPELRVFLGGRQANAAPGAPQLTGWPTVYTPKSLAAQWCVSPTTVRRWCTQGRFPGAWRTGAGHWRIPADTLSEFQPPTPPGGDRRSAHYLRQREALDTAP